MTLFTIESSDAELSKGIIESNVVAFKVLYFRYHESLFHFLWRRSHNYEIAQDLTQELFLRIWNQHKSLDVNQSIKAYLYRIAHNLVIDHLRKKSVESAYLAENPPDEMVSSEEDQVDLRDKIITSIDELPEPLRLVFTFSRFEGLKYREIAEALDISIKTVESRMSKALKILREKLHPFLASLTFLPFFS